MTASGPTSASPDMPDEKELTEEELRAMELRAKAATPGPWHSYIEGRDHTSGSSFIMTGNPGQQGDDIELLGASDADQDFIAAARQDVPRLIAEVRRLKQRLPLGQ